MSEEKINHPNHYNWIPGIECFDVVRHMKYNLGTAVAYIWRAGRKRGTPEIEDLRKAIKHLEDEVKYLERQQNVITADKIIAKL